MATDICLPVQKFSHATGVRADNTIAWTHLLAADLFVVIRRVAEKLTTRIVHGTKVLETVDAGGYIDKANAIRRGSERDSVNLQVDQLPIFGITKHSQLALRYRLGDGQARRIQLRMQNPDDCQRIVNMFKQRGMEFQDQVSRAERPGSVRRPATDSSQKRPLTLQSSSPYFDSGHSPAGPNPFVQPQVLEAGSLSHRPLSPDRPLTMEHQDLRRSEAPPHGMPPPTLFRRNEATAPREIVPDRPRTSEIFRAHTDISQRFQCDVPQVEDQPFQSATTKASTTSETANLEASADAARDYISPPRVTSDMPPTILLQSQGNETWSSETVAPSIAGLSTDSVAGLPQNAATTAVAGTHEPEFSIHRNTSTGGFGSQHSAGNRSNSRPSSAALTLPPLPKPSMLSERPASSAQSISISPPKAVSAARPHTASPLKNYFTANENGVERPGTAAGISYSNKRHLVQTAATSPMKRKYPSDERDIAESVHAAGSGSPDTSREPSTHKPISPASQANASNIFSRSPSRMNDLLYGQKVLAERSTNANKIRRLGSLADAPHEIVSPPRSPDRGSTLASSEQELRDYAEQSSQDRAAALDEFMIANIENADFMVLCRDVENSWRRICIGP